ncbi:MAG: hypoxanthine phosphoribosyltransferase [Oscillospiraceae bacterium]|nr:hypoxanthine phosphoribosyltransferase [Oscillospiraceae bacterium]MBQ9930217.1 hypoxanthine phosphoribosyltransferase [Oscillospiraceae bacterium]
MERDIAEVLLSQEQLQTRIRELGEILTAEYAGKNPIVVGVLKGVVIFYADMIRQIKVPCQMDFMRVSSYQGTQSTGKAVFGGKMSENIEGRHVLILEDIFDTGNSLNFLYNHLIQKNPASIKICTLLDKPSRRNPEITLKPDWVGFEVPNAFVVGYGLDYNEAYRNLPYIGILKPEVYAE